VLRFVENPYFIFPSFSVDAVCIGVYYLRMTSKEIIRRLESEGWYCAGGKGDHQKYKHPSKAGHVVVPHPRKDMPTGTLRNIFRQAGWEWR
jgi:predicted RNA binding protein YcfA (HicA-like mRNA interferase family)